MTTSEAHRVAYDGMLHTIERIENDKLADRVTIYRRGNEVIYTNELRGDQWMHKPQARAAIEAERARPMNKQEYLAFVQGFNKLAVMLAKPERQASLAEIRSLEVLRRQAYAVLLDAEFSHTDPLHLV